MKSPSRPLFCPCDVTIKSMHIFFFLDFVILFRLNVDDDLKNHVAQITNTSVELNSKKH